jgi:hypothetical protein
MLRFGTTGIFALVRGSTSLSERNMRMRARRLALLLRAVFCMMWATAAMADPRDSVERSHRMDTDALRDDIETNRLSAPAHPLMIAPEPQPAPVSKRKKKPRASSSSSNR